jgi:TRAP-type C4-dicarboxylate transport system permease small subunit
MERLLQLQRGLNLAFMALGGCAVIALMVLATGNVLFRIVHVPFPGTYEGVSFLGAVVIVFALGYTQQRKDHIVVDILSQHYPPALRRVADALSAAIVAGFFAVAAWQIFRWGLQIGASGEVSETLKIAYHPFVYAVALGVGSLSLAGLVDLLLAVAGYRGKARP